MQLGSGWKPGRMGFWYVEFFARTWTIMTKSKMTDWKNILVDSFREIKCFHQLDRTRWGMLKYYEMYTF